MDRRTFLLAGSAAGVSLGMRAQPSDRAPGQTPWPRPARSIYLDAQGVIDGFDATGGGRFVATPRLVRAIRERRVDIVSATMGVVGNGPDRSREAMEWIASWDRVIADHPGLVAKIETPADIRSAIASGKLGIIYNFQDTTALETDASRVDLFATLGVRIIQLTYNKRNLAGDGCLERANAGLSDFGRELVAGINRAKVLLDLSHAGQRTAAEGIAASTAPPAITHGGCRSLVDNPRNTYDGEMRALANKGGIFGLYLMPFLRLRGQPEPADLFRHLEHAVNVCGEDHVGIGTDNNLFGYTMSAESRAAHRRFIADRQRRGIAAPGESPDVLLMVEGYNGPDRFDRIAADLKRRGWSTARVEKVLGANFVRLLGEIWGSQAG